MIRHFLSAIFLWFAFSFPTFSQTRSLDYYLDLGVKQSPLLKDYNYQLQSKDIDSMEVHARLKPLVTANSVAIYAPTFNGQGYEEAITNGGTFSVLGGVNVPLLNKKLKQSQYGAISAEKQGIGVSAKISEHDLRKSISDQYIVAYQDARQVEFSQRVNELLSKEFELLKAQVDAGIYKRSDLLALTIEVHTNEIGTEQLKQQYRDDLFLLNYLCGVSDTSSIQLEKPDMQYHSASFVYNSPVFLKFAVDSITIESNRRLIDANYRPKLNAFADAGINAISLKDVQQKIGFSLGASFSVPIYDGHQRRMEYNKLNLAERTRKDYRDFYSEQIAIRLQQLDAQKNANQLLLQKIKDEKQEVETLLSMNREEMNSGIISVTDYIVTLRNYIDLQSQLNTSEIKSYQLINEYNYIAW